MGIPEEAERLQHEKSHTPPARPPAPPDPSNDAGVIPPIQSPPPDEDVIPDGPIDIFTLTPVAALKLLCRSIDTLVRFTGDIPPTPPIRSRGPSPSRPDGPDIGKENRSFLTPHKRNPSATQLHLMTQPIPHPNEKSPIGSPEASHHEPHPPPTSSQPSPAEQGSQSPASYELLLARKFYSKRPPPISTTDYLLRLHKYCPMSTGVYLATSSYITRMAVRERVIPVTPRNVHRLLLAGLRVAMKALEDLSWPHARFSRVGGVTEKELGKLEVTFCFLMSFELRVDAPALTTEAEALRAIGRRGSGGSAVVDVDSPVSMTFDLKMPEIRRRQQQQHQAGVAGEGEGKHGEKRKASSVLPSRPAVGIGVD